MKDGMRVGELARRTGLTVRALHHYDEIGLLTPAERTFAGHRLYSEADVRRLYRIVALRRVGVPLAEIGAALDGDADVAEVMRRQLAELEREIAERTGLRDRLRAILAGLERADEPSVADLLDTIEETTTMERHYTPEQLEQLAERREELGEAAIGSVEDEWPRLYAGIQEAIDRGAEPDDPEVQRIAARMRELIALFHGGDEGIEEAQRRTWSETPREEMVAALKRQGVEDAEARVPTREVTEFVARAHAVAGGC